MHTFRTGVGSKDFSTELAGSEVNRQTGIFDRRHRGRVAVQTEGQLLGF